MQFLHSLLFTILLNLWGTLIPIIYFPAFITRSRKLADHGAKVWAIGCMWMLKKICGVEYEFRGLENLPKEACIIACKHQSAWETIIMHLVVRHPVYVYKKELEMIPFYGWYLKIMSGIKLNRKGGAGALKSMIKQSKSYLEHGQSIVLFPQGTRVPLGGEVEKYPYQSGVAALYLSCNVKVVPAALNSGAFWPKHKITKNPGKIILEFLPAIAPGLKKDEFNKKLEEVIEKSSSELPKN
jgi:1-acyl-sn-glycerol-3-phosphate acyltransferase